MPVTFSDADIQIIRSKVQNWDRKPTKHPRRKVLFESGPLDGIQLALELSYEPKFLATAHLLPYGLVQIIYRSKGQGVWAFDEIVVPPVTTILRTRETVRPPTST